MRRLTRLALFTAIALILSLVESAFPPLLPVPGIRLGLANVVTLILLYAAGPRDAFIVLILRIILASIFAGQGMSFFYSLAGGLLSFCVLCCLKRFLQGSFILLASVFGALSHNGGQLLTAVLITQTPALWAYAPILFVSGAVTGLFTGLCALLCLRHLPGISKSCGDSSETF